MAETLRCDSCGEEITLTADLLRQTQMCPYCGGPIRFVPPEQELPHDEKETVMLGGNEAPTMPPSMPPTQPPPHKNPAESDQSYVPFTDPDMVEESVPPSESKTQLLHSDDQETLLINEGQETESRPGTAPPASEGPVRHVQDEIPTQPRTPRPSTGDIRPEDMPKTTPPGPTPSSRSSQSRTSGSTDRHGVDALLGQTIDGYVLKKKLGAGGMGSVFLAHQISLDRDVAIKILPPALAADPAFIARFTREALTAAQLNHHNITQVIDVGSENDLHYISMEFVRGNDLGNMTRTEGRLAFEDAAGYVLQAARGLQFAHERGIIHRDIKPDNIMVNEHGIVKVADMGLAKMKGGNERDDEIGLDYGDRKEILDQARGELTGVSVAMGTPSYMAPEQGQDASKVDHRADQYSLGCTLYYLVAGKAPFSGKTSFEIISKHMSEPVAPLETVVKNVPKELTFIIEKMLAKHADERYPSLRGVIEDLETYLGIDSRKGPYTPREHHLEMLDQFQKGFYSVASLNLRKVARLGFLFGTILFIAISAVFLNSVFFSAAFLGLLVLTPLFNFVINGVVTKDYLFRRVRSVFFGMSFKSWGMTICGTLIGLAILHIFSLLIPWVLVSVVAFGLALAYQIVIGGKIRRERTKVLEQTHEMLRGLRIRGVSEDALQDFVCRYTGNRWEEFFEALFGYEDMILQRGRSAKREKVRNRKRYAIWRDPIARWVDEIEEGRRRAREQKAIARAEKERLKAEGLSEQEADLEATKLAGDAINEGLLKDTEILEGLPSKEEAEQASIDLSKSKHKKGKVFWAYRLVRIAFALFLIGSMVVPLALSFGVPIPGFITGIYSNFFNGLSHRFFFPGFVIAGSVSALVGLILLLSSFSGRVLIPTLVFLGAVFLTYMVPIMGLVGRDLGQPLNLYGSLGGGFIAVLGGFVLMILAKVGGGRY